MKVETQVEVVNYIFTFARVSSTLYKKVSRFLTKKRNKMVRVFTKGDILKNFHPEKRGCKN